MRFQSFTVEETQQTDPLYIQRKLSRNHEENPYKLDCSNYLKIISNVFIKRYVVLLLET